MSSGRRQARRDVDAPVPVSLRRTASKHQARDRRNRVRPSGDELDLIRDYRRRGIAATRLPEEAVLLPRRYIEVERWSDAMSGARRIQHQCAA